MDAGLLTAAVTKIADQLGAAVEALRAVIAGAGFARLGLDRTRQHPARYGVANAFRAPDHLSFLPSRAVMHKRFARAR
jgi:hypothetical protein